MARSICLKTSRLSSESSTTRMNATLLFVIGRPKLVPHTNQQLYRGKLPVTERSGLDIGQKGKPSLLGGLAVLGEHNQTLRPALARVKHYVRYCAQGHGAREHTEPLCSWRYASSGDTEGLLVAPPEKLRAVRRGRQSYVNAHHVLPLYRHGRLWTAARCGWSSN